MAFELVRCIYEQTELPTKEPEYYQKALQEIETHGISSQVYYLLQKQGWLAETPPFFQVRLKEKYTQGYYLNFFIKNQTDRLLKKFAEWELEVIPLKGIYFAEKYFGHFAARATSDIDLLIKEADIDKAVVCVKDSGFTVEEEMIPGHFHCSFSKILPQSPLPLVVEIHWDIMREQTANFEISDFWKDAVPIENSLYIKELSPYHTFYLMILHGWRHNLDSLKYYMDIMEMIHYLKDEVDYEQLLSDARKHKTRKRVVRTLSILYQEFPYLDKIKKFSERRPDGFWKYRSRKNWKKYIDFIDYQFLSYDTLKHRFIELFHWSLPNHREVSSQGGGKKYHSPKDYFSLLKTRFVELLKAIFLLL